MTQIKLLLFFICINPLLSSEKVEDPIWIFITPNGDIKIDKKPFQKNKIKEFIKNIQDGKSVRFTSFNKVVGKEVKKYLLDYKIKFHEKITATVTASVEEPKNLQKGTEINIKEVVEPNPYQTKKNIPQVGININKKQSEKKVHGYLIGSDKKNDEERSKELKLSPRRLKRLNQ